MTDLSTQTNSLDEGAKHFIGGKRVDAGYILHLTPPQAHAMRDRVTLVDDVPISDTPPEPVDKVATEVEQKSGLISEHNLPDIGIMTMAEAKQCVKAIDNVDILIDLLELETRKSVANTIEKRLSQLGEE